MRRGLAPAMIGPCAPLDVSAGSAVPAALAQSTIDAAVNATVSAGVSSLALATMKSMLLTNVKTSSIVLAAGILLAGVATAGHGRPDAEAHARLQRVEQKEETAAARPSPYAWQRTTRYDPPDFEAFFPKDSRDAADLTRLWESGELQKKPREEIMRTVRAKPARDDGKTG